MHVLKKEKLNFCKIFLSIMTIMSGLRAEDDSDRLTGDTLGISPLQALTYYFSNYKNSKNPKINSFDLIEKIDVQKGEHKFINQSNCHQAGTKLVCSHDDFVYIQELTIVRGLGEKEITNDYYTIELTKLYNGSASVC